jgi:hypothetical protein
MSHRKGAQVERGTDPATRAAATDSAATQSVGSVIGTFEGAEAAAARVAAEMDALSLEELAVVNLDIVSGASIILGVADRILDYRDRMAALPEFDVKYVDNLKDYAMAAWFTHISNLPAPEPKDTEALVKEVLELRSKLLLWATPLVASGFFEPGAIDKIRNGGGHKDAASDVVALVGLYRAKWDDVKNRSAITDAELERAAAIAPRVFILLSQRDHRTASPGSAGSLRVRRAWTLAERAYGQCRRALAFLLFGEREVDDIAPNVRRNVGGTTKSTSKTSGVVPANTEPGGVPSAPIGGDAIGGGDGPFEASA